MGGWSAGSGGSGRGRLGIQLREEHRNVRFSGQIATRSGERVRDRSVVAVKAVIFDWGGTLTPWHEIDHDAMWLQVCAQHYPAAQAAELAAAVRAAEIAGDRKSVV